ncbi:putative urea ABC transporter substrate-binding protein [Phytopseudomonas dryadis]|uniref:Lipid kinase n=1 Tax=Phytopseudomonas dryadis TaxID=2487520 RepID=A0A4Q9R1D6_9GAMM|nr:MULTISPECIES: putative urea ABC transporter substrate-binding protein [Pseudomonas]TBU92590.1 lipid kinase [Pseudomonas dryadis]TBV02998.1 lipid kinase [Pseudomonas dryadis]TBV17726.1 lipid kinase [Pseudomonas sp. FRB 230]
MQAQAFNHWGRRLFAVFTLALALLAQPALAKEQFRIAWVLYPGFMPLDYAQRSGILDKWAQQYGIDIEVVQVNDYIEAVNQYSAGEFDICLMATMDALTIPAASGVDSTVLNIVDYSNGNDAIILKHGQTLADIRGQRVNIVQFSISHYFLARALESVGLSERELTLVNTSDADMVSLYGQPSVSAMVTWNPMVSDILRRDDAHLVFDSRQMPGELTDAIVAHTATLEQNPALGKALIGAWFETLAVMRRDDEQGRQARETMGIAAGTDRAGYEQQLAATHLFYSAQEAVDFISDPQLAKTMARIAEFSFDKGLLGNAAPSAGAVGMAFTDGSVYGDPGNVKLRFDDRFLRMAVDGELRSTP